MVVTIVVLHMQHFYQKRNTTPVLINSGTWTIIMSRFTKEKVIDNSLDNYIGTNALDKPIMVSRFMGGREYKIIKKMFQNIEIQNCQIYKILSLMIFFVYLRFHQLVDLLNQKRYCIRYKKTINKWFSIIISLSFSYDYILSKEND